MDIHLHHHHHVHFGDEQPKWLLVLLDQMRTDAMEAYENLKSALRNQQAALNTLTVTIKSAVNDLGDLRNQLKDALDAGADPAALQEIANQLGQQVDILNSSNDSLSQAVALDAHGVGAAVAAAAGTGSGASGSSNADAAAAAGAGAVTDTVNASASTGNVAATGDGAASAGNGDAPASTGNAAAATADAAATGDAAAGTGTADTAAQPSA